MPPQQCSCLASFAAFVLPVNVVLLGAIEVIWSFASCSDDHFSIAPKFREQANDHRSMAAQRQTRLARSLAYYAGGHVCLPFCHERHSTAGSQHLL